jgi:drug/metabolite transporter, DME family
LEPSRVRYRLYLVATALLFSTGGAAIKSATLSGWQVASFRSGVAAVLLVLVMPEARRGWSWRVPPVAAAYAATLVLFVLANRLTTAANAIFLQSTAPLYVLFLAPFLLGERIRSRDLVYAAVVAGGLALFFVSSEQALATAPDPRRGNLVGLAAGLSWALTVTGLRWLGRNGTTGSAMAPVVLGNAFACLVALPMAVPIAAVTGADAAIILYLGAIQVGLAYVLMARGLRHVPAFEASAVLLIEPVMSPVWTWLVHHEKPGPWALAGGAIIILATLANTWLTAGSGRASKVSCPIGR